MKVMPPIACVTIREVITSVVGVRVINSAGEVGRPLGTAFEENVATGLIVVGDALGKLENVGNFISIYLFI